MIIFFFQKIIAWKIIVIDHVDLSSSARRERESERVRERERESERERERENNMFVEI
jgi:hypothetical protein